MELVSGRSKKVKKIITIILRLSAQYVLELTLFRDHITPQDYSAIC